MPNYLDLDSDNDTVLMLMKLVFNGDGDTKWRWFSDGGDSDNDGILDIFDNYVGFGTENHCHKTPWARAILIILN